MRKLFEAAINIVFPPRCEVCKQNSEEVLCAECFEQIKFMKPHLGVHCVSAYEGVVKTAIHRFKFKKRKRLAEPLGILMVNYLSQLPNLETKEIDVVIPVPLHARRLRQRGFNQVYLLAEIVSRYFGIPVVKALARSKNTSAQFGLPRQERFKNIKGAFKVIDSKAVFNKRLLLMDDIYTTGSTITECAKTLKIAGAKRIDILTLSRAMEV